MSDRAEEVKCRRCGQWHSGIALDGMPTDYCEDCWAAVGVKRLSKPAAETPSEPWMTRDQFKVRADSGNTDELLEFFDIATIRIAELSRDLAATRAASAEGPSEWASTALRTVEWVLEQKSIANDTGVIHGLRNVASALRRAVAPPSVGDTP